MMHDKYMEAEYFAVRSQAYNLKTRHGVAALSNYLRITPRLRLLPVNKALAIIN